MVALPALTRRGLLAAAALGALAGCGGGSDDEEPPLTDQLAYGTTHPDQFGVLSTPLTKARALIVLVHGGFWASSFGLELMQPIARDLVDAGFATWNIEYRRLGKGGGWPATFEDVAAAFDYLPSIPSLADRIGHDLPVLAIGHSAGGQLAAWAASRTSGTPGGAPKLVAERTFSLGGVLDLSTAAREGVGGPAADWLLGGPPAQVPVRYRKADPALLTPRTPVTVVVGDQDSLVPASQATAYLRKHPDLTTRLDVPGNHYSLINPLAPAWRRIRAAVVVAAKHR